MTTWTLDSIPWQRFQPALVDPMLLALAKTACLVEYNSHVYGRYLCEIFADQPTMCTAIQRWAEEEVQHGLALRRWCELADPTYDFPTAFADFSQRIRLPTGLTGSVRGSRSGELLARCVVECATSLYYSCLHQRVREPVLKVICARITSDEFRHYRQFYDQSRAWMELDPLPIHQRLRVVLSRMIEAEDDELAYAWHCSTAHRRPYLRRQALAEYLHTSLGVLRARPIERAISMVLRAAGFALKARSAQALATVILRLTRWRMRRIANRIGASGEGSMARGRLGRGPSPVRPGLRLDQALPSPVLPGLSVA